MRALQRRAADRRDDRRSPDGSAARRWRPATTPASSTTARARCSRPPPTGPRTRPTCSPGWRRRCSRACASRSRDLTKPRGPRARSRRGGLAVAGRPESQDLCFLAGEGKRDFLARHGGLRERPGAIVDRSGRRVGAHPGHHQFTVGQRRGLGVAAPEPLYVLATDAAGQHRHRRPARGARDDPGPGPRGRPFTGPAGESTGCGCATTRAGDRLRGGRRRRGRAPRALPAARRARLRRRARPDRLPDVRRGRRRARDDRLRRSSPT